MTAAPLPHGSEAGTPLDADGYVALAAKIARETPFACESYKEHCIRRRLAVRMRARATRTYEEYAALLDGDPAEYTRLLDALTVNVTRFFRNPTTFAAIARDVVPRLWARGDEIRVWCAGAASGEEPYSIAAVFHVHAAEAGALHALQRVDILATDIDRASLEAAARASYPAVAFAETDLDRYGQLFPLADGETRGVCAAARRLVRIARHDLLRDTPPTGSFDLIFCRNLLIYLSPDGQEAALRALHGALAPDGYLVLGRAEMLLGRARALFTPFDSRERIFRRGGERG